MDLRGTPLYGQNFQHYDHFFCSKMPKNCFFAQKTPDFGPKKSYGFGGEPPPLYGKNSAKRQLRIWGVPPPLTDKIRKVVFEVLP